MQDRRFAQRHSGCTCRAADTGRGSGARRRVLTRLALLFILLLLLQFDAEEVLLFGFLFQLFFYGPWGPAK